MVKLRSRLTPLPLPRPLQTVVGLSFDAGAGVASTVFHGLCVSSLLALVALIGPSQTWGAACCGGHAAIPALITGYESARINSTLSQTTLVGNAPPDGRPVFRDPGNRPTTSTLLLSGTRTLAPRWQTGAGIPIGIGSDVGDAQALIAWEAIPRADVLSSQPRLLIFAQTIVPTGRSSNEPGVVDEGQVTGQGFYRAGGGALALAIHRKWDFFAMPRATAGFTRAFDGNGSTERTIDPGWQGDISLGAGYALNAEWRFGGSLTSSFAEGSQVREANGTARSLSSSLRWPLEAQVAWFYNLDGLVALSYVDETIIGPARGAALTRTIGLQFSYRWDEI